jgi:PAS domain S-box-containing protein
MIYNDAYAIFAGGRHPQLLGSKVLEGWHEVAAFNAHVLEVGLAGGTLSFTDQELVLYRNGSAETIWADLDYSPVFDEAGRPFGIIAIVIETTERVKAQRWKDAEQDRLRLMFEQAPGFMAMLEGPEHRFVLTNPGYQRLIDHRHVLGKAITEALPDAVEQGFGALLDQVFRTGVAYTAESALYSVQAEPNGPTVDRYVDFVFQPFRDQTGAVIGIFVQGSDVTDRRDAERRLFESEAHNREIIDAASDYAIIATDLTGRITRWNRGAERLLGWAETEALGQDLGIVFSPEDRRAGVDAQERKEAARVGHARSEGWRHRSNGERFWGSGELTPVLDASGAVTGFVKVLRDRTEAQQAAARLAQAQQAGGVGVFTLDLTTNELTGTPELCRVYGLPDREIFPVADIERLVVPDDAPQVLNSRRRTAGDAPVEVEYRIRRASDGAERIIYRKAEYERDAKGAPVRLAGVVQDVTERRAAEQALQASQAQFEALAQAMPNQAWTARPDGYLDWFNAQVYAYTGGPQGTLDGANWTRLLHPEDLAEAQTAWSAALASGREYKAEFRLRSAEGEWRWHLARAVPVRGSDGAILRWIGTNTDIHDQKLAEVASNRDRDRMWSMSQDLMLVCDFEGLITAVNPSAERMLGWRQDELVGATLADFLHPDDFESTQAQLGLLSAGKTTLAFENRYRTKSGDYRLLDWTAVPDQGRIHAVGRDITEQRALARDQERIWTLSPVLKLIADEAGVIQTVNPAWTRVLGWSLAETAGRPLASFLADGENVALARTLNAKNAHLVDQQLMLTTQSGAPRHVTWDFLREGGMLYGFGRDVSEQRAVEEALRQSQKMEAVGQLTGGIAHDFNNLLQGITGSLDLIQKRVTQGRIAELERFIIGAMTSANRASALTHRLLAFSRRQPLDPRPVRGNPLVASMEDLLRRTLGERVELELALAGGLWLTKCDPNQLESAILNLAINARDAMPHGGKLTIETCNAHLDSLYAARQRDVRPGQYVCICVTDTGVGMDAETIQRAFEPFFTTKPIGQGTGLGLSMIYGFAQQSQGYAKIYSEVGKGTTFKLYLPRFRGEAESEEELPQFSNAHLAERGETVLVVEDEPVVRGLIVEVLSDLGYRAIEAADGQQGVDALHSRRRIDLLITDIGLPGINGRQVADAGRARRPDLKVLFMTGYAENAALASGFLEPGMAMITKPFAMEHLATRIREIIEGS